MLGYYIMPKYERSVQDTKIFFLKPHETLKLMSQVINCLRVLHSTGYTHNDLKPANVMVDSQFNATLIDLGCAMTFLDPDGKHIKRKPFSLFKGNLLFSSLSQMEFKTTSRKDDMISAAYMLMTLLNGNKFPIIQ